MPCCAVRRKVRELALIAAVVAFLVSESRFKIRCETGRVGGSPGGGVEGKCRYSVPGFNPARARCKPDARRPASVVLSCLFLVARREHVLRLHVKSVDVELVLRFPVFCKVLDYYVVVSTLQQAYRVFPYLSAGDSSIFSYLPGPLNRFSLP